MWFQRGKLKKSTLFGAEDITVMWATGVLPAKLYFRSDMANEPTDILLLHVISYLVCSSPKQPNMQLCLLQSSGHAVVPVQVLILQISHSPSE